MTGHDAPGVDSDVERDLAAQAPRPARIERGHPRVEIERGMERPLGIVLVGAGSAEHGHDGVAHVLLHEPAVALNARRHLAEQSILEGPYVLGIQALADGGEASEVREEDGGGTAIFGFFLLTSIGLRDLARRGAQARAAAGAEGEVGGRRRATGGARLWQGAPALRAEGEIGGGLEPTTCARQHGGPSIWWALHPERRRL